MNEGKSFLGGLGAGSITLLITQWIIWILAEIISKLSFIAQADQGIFNIVFWILLNVIVLGEISIILTALAGWLSYEILRAV